MKFLEKDLEEIVFNSNRSELLKRGLYVPRFKKRQLRIGNYGIADIVGYEMDYESNGFFGKRHKIHVIELKQDKISMSTFLQAVRYAKGVLSFLNKRDSNVDSPIIIITLIGKDIDKCSDFIYLTDILESNNFVLEYKTYSYEIDGIKFKHECNYSLVNEGF